ncbi:hypothetical protein GCM10020220_001390 [Nonomuraea rubra]
MTALQAVEEMDAGPIWGFRTFAMPAEAPRKSALYNGPVAEAAAELVVEVAAKAGDASFVPVPLDYRSAGGAGAVAAGDAACRSGVLVVGADGRTSCGGCGRPMVRRAGGRSCAVCRCGVFDVYRGPELAGVAGQVPGQVAGRREGAVLVHTGDGTVWVGHLRLEQEGAIKLRRRWHWVRPCRGCRSGRGTARSPMTAVRAWGW